MALKMGFAKVTLPETHILLSVYHSISVKTVAHRTL